MAILHQPDMILLPGTKSTLQDLLWLRQSGLEAAIQKAAAAGTLVMGICGGYQMLGRRISDPEQVEAAGMTEAAGMGLLDMDTVFAGQKSPDTDARDFLRHNRDAFGAEWVLLCRIREYIWAAVGHPCPR